jgi:hypothetical protein
MSKVIAATCVANIVTADSVPVPVATVLSQGISPSSGVLVMDEGRAYYIPNNSSDLKDVLVSIDAILQQLLLTLTGLDAVTVSPGSNAALITALGLLKAQLALKQELLK